MKLHFYRTIGNFRQKVASGDGAVNNIGEFTVTITWGSVERDYHYEIQAGQRHLDGKYLCIAGAETGETARFEKWADFDLVRADEDHFGATLALRAAFQASEKTVNIVINQDDLAALKDSKYMLCFAKRVAQGDYNVVWQSYSLYLFNNTFSWTPQYQLFGSNVFKENVHVKVSTNPVSIGLGQQSILSKSGVLGNPKTGGPETAITMLNEYGSIHPGVNQLSTGLDGSQVSTPIYVAPKPIVLGTNSLTPIELVQVWFEQEIETGTMFSTARSNSTEIDLTHDNSQTRLYKGQKWIVQ